MQLVEDGQHMDGNGLCFLCETAVDRRQAVVNTRFPFDPDFHHPLVGMKYVCEHCVRAMAELLGLGDVAAPTVIEVQVDKTPDILKRIEKQLNNASSPPVAKKAVST